MIPLAVLSVPRKYLIITELQIGYRTDLIYAVANYGLGKDMWEVEPDNITNILYVSNSSWFLSLGILAQERSIRPQ